MNTLIDYISRTPHWLIALLMIAGGWTIARLAQILSAKALRLFRFNQFCDRIGLSEALHKGDVTLSPSELVGRGLHWLILLTVLMETARYLDIGMAAEMRQWAISTIPSLLSAALVLAVGLILVGFLAGVVRTLSRNAGNPYANLLARITRWTGTTLVLTLAVEQSGIRGSVFVGVLYIFIAGLAFGLALAFGLGCKDMARAAMDKWIANLKESHRDSSNPDLEG